jgi:hypothetical protein
MARACQIVDHVDVDFDLVAAELDLPHCPFEIGRLSGELPPASVPGSEVCSRSVSNKFSDVSQANPAIGLRNPSSARSLAMR